MTEQAGVKIASLIQGGVCTNHRVFSLAIPAVVGVNATGRRQLTLFVGLCESAGNMTATVGGLSASNVVQLPAIGHRAMQCERSPSTRNRLW